MKKLKLLFLISLTAFCVTGCDLSQFIQINDGTSQKEDSEGSGGTTPSGDDEGGGGSSGGDSSGGGDGSGSIDYDPDWTDEGEVISSGYYQGLDTRERGKTLLANLRTLNMKKRKNETSYNSMNDLFKYTDYDPSTVRYDSKNQPYGTKILSFYSGKSTTSFNKEHVWPNSRGGGKEKGWSGAPYVENDIFMVRPTVNEENSNRGNSSYVEGMVDGSKGWDPVAAFEKSMGVYTSIRGECARIIFYCMTVNAKLQLVDDANIEFEKVGKRVTMGKLSDMLRWNLENPVNEREERRQDGGEYLQSNRNAFVDHPELACKIWGTYNNTTKQICRGKY